MAVKRDYGSFSRASVKLLTPMVAHFGFVHRKGTQFMRSHNGWADSFFLYQTGYGTGDFCVNIGAAVPELDDYWQQPGTGLIISWRLSDKATEDGGDCWYPAKNKEQLQASLERASRNLERALPWFEQFQRLHDVVEGFRTRSRVSPRIEDYPLDAYPTFAMNYAFLLALDGRVQDALAWLSVAHARAMIPRYWDPITRNILATRMPGTRVIRRTVEDERQVEIIEAAIQRLAE